MSPAKKYDAERKKGDKTFWAEATPANTIMLRKIKYSMLVSYELEDVEGLNMLGTDAAHLAIEITHKASFHHFWLTQNTASIAAAEKMTSASSLRRSRSASTAAQETTSSISEPFLVQFTGTSGGRLSLKPEIFKISLACVGSLSNAYFENSLKDSLRICSQDVDLTQLMQTKGLHPALLDSAESIRVIVFPGSLGIRAPIRSSIENLRISLRFTVRPCENVQQPSSDNLFKRILGYTKELSPESEDEAENINNTDAHQHIIESLRDLETSVKSLQEENRALNQQVKALITLFKNLDEQ